MALPEEEIDRLYGLPPEHFTAARDELARSSRSQGDKDAANEIKRLRKPSLIAWALNQAARREPLLVGALIEAGDRLRDAQQQLVKRGDPGALRAAATDERRLVEEVVAIAERQLREAGHPLGGTLPGKLPATVHAAAAGGEARDLLRAGRLVHEYEISDLGLGLGAAPAELKPKARTQPIKAEAKPKADADSEAAAAAERKAQAAAEREAREIRRRLERARAQQKSLEGKLAEAERRVSEAEREATRAAAALERAQAAAEQVRVRVTEAAAKTAELERSLR